MEGFSDDFLRNNQSALKYYSRKWVANPLYTWSRRWEYVFAYERVKQLADTQVPNNLRLLDAGCGLTFFPHFLLARHHGISIDCCDSDPQLQADAKKLVAPASPAVSYSLQDMSAPTYPPSSFDAVYCISVLEHIDHREEVVAAFARILKPGGRLILTFDISLDDRSTPTREQAASLIGQIGHRFAPDSDYMTLVNKCDESQIATTEYALKVDPSLLPWRPRGFYESLRGFAHDGRRNIPFSYLTFFCTGWTLPKVISSSGS
jgi:2-polyprenyl-3-methyl-5-hydroxy-6-metoxy-1,4-benzoquinol methylase